MCKTCVIYGQNRMAKWFLGGVYVAKLARYAAFTGENRVTACKYAKDAQLTGQK